jgi:predicted ATPase
MRIVRTGASRHHCQTVILTPDQRLRVFVSSTLEELAAERTVVRRAIESLQLTPVMFELGARPHPPTSLYRAYLEQSHVFVAVYAERYGWVPPDMEISGLEDEYGLATRLPRLVYVKERAPGREPRLQALIKRIESEGAVSYKRFSSAAELEQLVREDLVTLLSERFAARSPGDRAPVPAPAAPLVGRSSELRELGDLLVRRRVRLVTVTGPGGVGKSRLAIEAARELAKDFPGGVFFVPLEPLDDAGAVPATLTRTLGLSVAAGEDELAAVRDFLHGAPALLYLDNFEHLLDAAQFVAALLSEAPDLALLVTSRAALRLRGEHEYALEPLARSDATQLFLDRARAAGGTFAVEAESEADIAELCEQLDRLPLAIELAAARTKLLPPSRLLERLADRLDLGGSDRRDLPDRHQGLRATIAWSYELLDPAEQELFARLAVFVGRFTLEAAEAVCTDAEVDVVAGLSSLIDQSLVRSAAQGPEPGFAMLETIRRFALDVLEAAPFAQDVRRAHASFFVQRALDAHDGLRDARQAAWQASLEADAGNLEAALHWWLAHEGDDTLADVASSLWPFWWLAGRLSEGRDLIESVLERREAMSAPAVGRALATRASVAFLQGDFERALGDATEALELGLEAEAAYCLAVIGTIRLFSTAGAAGEEDLQAALRGLESAGDRWGVVRVHNVLNWVLQLTGRLPDSDDGYRAVLAAAEELGSPQEVSMAQANLGRFHVLRGEAGSGLPDLLQALDLSAEMQHKAAIASILEAVVEAAQALGANEQAARLLAAAKTLREAIGAPPAPGQAKRNELNEAALVESLGPEGFERISAEGGALTLDDALAEARALRPTGPPATAPARPLSA